MKSILCSSIAAIACLAAAPLLAQSPADVSLTRIDCAATGTPFPLAAFSDTMSLQGNKLQLTASCYLIRHGDQYMIWDTGWPTKSARPSDRIAKVPLVESLAQLKIKPEQIAYVGISHYHGDHTGQTDSFPQATLLIGQADWEVIKSPNASRIMNLAPMQFQHWLSGAGKMELVQKDKDVFGDGTVVMLDMPGHTPGHHSLLVKLKGMGNVLLTGDVAHLRENYESNGVPTFNFDRADTLASYDRFKQIAKNLNATVVIQHDPRDIEKLPAFPAAAN